MLQLFRQFNSVNICGDWYWLKPCLTNVFLYKTDDKNLKYYTYGKKDLQQQNLFKAINAYTKICSTGVYRSVWSRYSICEILFPM